MTVPRPEYPRPQFVRSTWQNLNGPWSFAFDDDDCGLLEQWYKPARGRDFFPLSIRVPFVYQSQLSGVYTRQFHRLMWYQRSFTIPAEWQEQRIILHCGAADYRAWVWVNGQFATFHEGGHTPFQVDITAWLESAGDNSLVIRVEDIPTDLTQPRGKQYWKEQSEGIFYTPSSGIWQTVWLEPVHPLHLTQVQFTPDIREGGVRITGKTSQPMLADLQMVITSPRGRVTTTSLTLKDGQFHSLIPLDDRHLWTPETPHLYDINLRLVAGNQVCDEVQSYFGLREIGIDKGRILLNGEPYLMKLVLDQGYFPRGLLTPSTDQAIRADIELTKEMGFNGVRKHQKVEDPRYLYWADRLGLLVWGEMANSYRFSTAAMSRLLTEWQAVIERDYNHPCIVAWVPLNESWGVPELNQDLRQVHFLLALYHQTKALDSTRLVMANDGWEHVRSDLCTVHDYCGDAAALTARYTNLAEVLAFKPSGRVLYVPGSTYQGEPIFISEFGGIAYRTHDEKGWGYTNADSPAALHSGYGQLVSALLSAPLVQGFCYTQLTDVEQEINGLLTFDRQPKLPVEMIRAINEGKWQALPLP